MPFRYKTICDTKETLHKMCEETMERMQKIKDAGNEIVSIWEWEFRKRLRDNLGFENEPSSNP
jgi:hypothetical protein